MGINVLHHVTVKTDDLEATRDFYRDVLGLEEGFPAGSRFPGLLALLRRRAGGASGAAAKRDRRRAVARHRAVRPFCFLGERL